MSKDKIIRCITSDGAIIASAIDSTNIVYTAKKLHNTSPVATAALGRLLTAASMMGAMLKETKATITLRVDGDGELGTVLAVGDSRGNVRGYAANPDCKTEYYNSHKINVAKAVGKGNLGVIKDFGTGEPYIGQTKLVSGEIAEDITAYYAASEQIPTVCALGVLLSKEDSEVMLSGGLLIQMLPGADEEAIEKLEKNISVLEPITTMLAKGMTTEEICKTALQGFETEILDEMPVDYVCTCSRKRVINSLITLPDEEIRTLPLISGKAEISCNFCSKKYEFTKEDLEEVISLKHTIQGQ